MTHRTAYVTKKDTRNVFFTKATTTLTLLDEKTYRPTEADATYRNPTPITTVTTIPYIKGTSETILRILQPYNIRVAHKPTTTLRHLEVVETSVTKNSSFRNYHHPDDQTIRTIFSFVICSTLENCIL